MATGGRAEIDGVAGASVMLDPKLVIAVPDLGEPPASAATDAAADLAAIGVPIVHTVHGEGTLT